MKFKNTKYGDLSNVDYEGHINVSGLGLTSLEGAPRSISGNFNCSRNKLKSLKGSPKKIEGSFNCNQNNYLFELTDGPEYVSGNCEVSFCRLKTLESAPAYVGTDFYCNDNELSSLKGAPKYIGRDFYCEVNLIDSLKGFDPKTVPGIFLCDENIGKYLEEEFELRRKNPELTEDEINEYMFEISGEEAYLPNAIKDVFLF